jgi:RNA methyltransferase, TrmH family
MSGRPPGLRREGSARPPPRRESELRLHGLNACLVAFARRPQDLRKVYLTEARLGTLREVLAHCVRQRLGYRVVAEDDLQRLTGSTHHEGVCFEMRPPPVPDLPTLIARKKGQASLLLYLDGVGNPHNLGAVLRSAAHFGVDAVLLPPGSGLALSGAACRVAEGGAEAVPLIRLGDRDTALAQLQAAGYQLAATLPRDAESLYAAPLPPRLVFVLGAEQSGLSAPLLAACTRRLGIPGSGAVESLNIATAAAVMVAEWRRCHPIG